MAVIEENNCIFGGLAGILMGEVFVKEGGGGKGIGSLFISFRLLFRYNCIFGLKLVGISGFLWMRIGMVLWL